MSDLATVVLAGLLGFAETLLGVGILLPGEVMITALSTTVGGTVLPWLGLAVMIGACTGDQLNYWLGRAWGPRMSESRLVRRLGPGHWQRGVSLVQQHGGWAVLVSRMLPVVRTLLPAVAGVARLSPVAFTCASVAGSALWTLLWVGTGAALPRLLGPALVPAAAAVALLALLLAGRRGLARQTARRRRQPDEPVVSASPAVSAAPAVPAAPAAPTSGKWHAAN